MLQLRKRLDEIQLEIAQNCKNNYPILIKNNQFTNEMHQKMQSLENAVYDLNQGIPDLQEEYKMHLQKMKFVQESNRSILSIVEYQSELNEILELPTTMKKCASEGSLEECVQWMTYGQTVMVAAWPNLKRDIKAASNEARKIVLHKLKTQVSLPECLSIVGILRQMDSILLDQDDEYEKRLQMEVLRCRQEWISAKVKSTLKVVDPQDRMVEMIDVMRRCWFDMIVQYEAMFVLEDALQEDALINRWLASQLKEWIVILKSTLCEVSSLGQVASIAEQAMFFGKTLGRLGCDFRGIVTTVFEEHVENFMVEKWTSATKLFQRNMEHSITSKVGGTPIVIWSIQKASSQVNATPSTDDTSPPRSLMAYPLLAELMNAYLATFNDLRYCAIVSLSVPLARRLQQELDYLSSFVSTMTVDHTEVGPTGTSSIQALSNALSVTFTPFLINAFLHIYSDQPSIRQLLGNNP